MISTQFLCIIISFQQHQWMWKYFKVNKEELFSLCFPTTFFSFKKFEAPVNKQADRTDMTAEQEWVKVETNYFNQMDNLQIRW